MEMYQGFLLVKPKEEKTLTDNALFEVVHSHEKESVGDIILIVPGSAQPAHYEGLFLIRNNDVVARLKKGKGKKLDE